MRGASSEERNGALGEWVLRAIKQADISQAELSRRLADFGLRTVDKSAVNKIVKGERKLTADQMLAIGAITKFPMPGVETIPQPMRETPPKESVVEKVELSRSTGHTVSETRLRRLLAKVFEMSRPQGMTSLLADNFAATILSVCRRRPDRQEDEPDEAEILAQAGALKVLFLLEPSP
jgi:transcriptional regulator with XRE-family HTH domain